MKFHELLKSVNWEDIKKSLTEHYPEEDTDIYHDIVHDLKRRDPVDVDMVIDIEEDTVEGNTWYHIVGRSLLEEKDYALDFTPWSQWLSCKIKDELFEKYKEEEIVAHCLFEMTYDGYDEEKIQERFEYLIRLKEQIENMSEEEKKEFFVPAEKVFDDISKEFGDNNEEKD